MQLFGRLHAINWAILPVGDNFTMDAQQAAVASSMLNCDKVIGVHYDTFGFIKIDHEASKQLFAVEGKELHLVPIGNSLNLE
ncbi:metal-dependent hydrolase [compost metagenome]